MHSLVDAQLPAALARLLESRGHKAQHVVDPGLTAADDRQIWDYALREGAVIVSNDENFAVLSTNGKRGTRVRLDSCGQYSKTGVACWARTVAANNTVSLCLPERRAA